MGILPQRHQILFQEEIEWDTKSSLILTKETNNMEIIKIFSTLKYMGGQD